MPIDLLTMPIMLKMPVGRGCASTRVTGEALVPDIKPDITRVLMSDYDVNRVDLSYRQGKCAVSGELEMQFVYVSAEEEKQVRGFTQMIPYSMDVDVPNLTEDMKCEAECRVVSYEAKPVTPRKIHVSL